MDVLKRVRNLEMKLSGCMTSECVEIKANNRRERQYINVRIY